MSKKVPTSGDADVEEVIENAAIIELTETNYDQIIVVKSLPYRHHNKYHSHYITLSPVTHFVDKSLLIATVVIHHHHTLTLADINIVVVYHTLSHITVTLQHQLHTLSTLRHVLIVTRRHLRYI